MNIFKPAWKSAYSYKAVKAVSKITDQSKLAQIAVEAPVKNARQAAIERLIPEQHQPLLASIAEKDTDDAVRQAAIRKLIPDQHQTLLASIAEKDTDNNARHAAVERLIPEHHQPLLASIVEKDYSDNVCQAAIAKLLPEQPQSVWAAIAGNGQSTNVRIAAIDKLIPDQHQPLLADIAREYAKATGISYHLYQLKNHDGHVSQAAVAKITDQSLIADLAEKASDSVRHAAVMKLNPEQHQPLLASIVQKDWSRTVRKAAIEKLIPDQHQPLLASIAEKDEYSYARIAAIKQLIPDQHQHLLASIAKEDAIEWESANNRTSYSVAHVEAAFASLTDQSLIADVAQNAKTHSVRKDAVDKLIPEQHQALLASMAENDLDYIRQAAYMKLTDISVKRSLVAGYAANLKENADILLSIYKREKDDNILDSIAQRRGEVLFADTHEDSHSDNGEYHSSCDHYDSHTDEGKNETHTFEP